MKQVCEKQKAFTIIELMITLAILAIMMGLAAPSFTKMIRDNRVQTASASFMGALGMARAEAIRRGKNVSMCAVNDPAAVPPVCNGAANGWVTGWVIFIDNDNDDVIDAGEEFRIGDALNSLAVVGPAGGIATFNSRGQPTAGMGNYIFDSSGCDAGVDKRFTVNLGTVGRTNAAEGTCP